jgi:hypothetical protein
MVGTAMELFAFQLIDLVSLMQFNETLMRIRCDGLDGASCYSARFSLGLMQVAAFLWVEFERNYCCLL